MTTPGVIRGERLDERIYAIVVEGEFDLMLQEAAIAETGRALGSGAEAILVDVQGCTFIDSTAIAAIVGAQQRALGAGLRFALAGHTPAVDRMIELTGLDAEVQLLDDRDAAIAELHAKS